MNPVPDEPLRHLARAAARTAAHEISCDQLLDRLAAYVESGAAAADAARRPAALPPELAAVRDHLAICPECTEELTALLRALEPDQP